MGGRTWVWVTVRWHYICRCQDTGLSKSAIPSQPPYAGLVLAELGAEVIKVERPGTGDDCRAWGPPFKDGTSGAFRGLNRNKQSITVDLKSEKGLAQIKSLARDADAVIQNLKPGLVDDLGIGPQDLRSINDRLVYASIHAFGSTGPLAQRPGYDPLMQAFGGIMSVQGEPDRPSVRVGTSIVDMGTGLWIAIGVLTALLQREKTGKGCIVDASLFETALGWMVYFLPIFAMSARLPKKSGSGVTMISPYQAFATADSELVIAAGNDNLFRKLCALLGHPEWYEDERFTTNGLRVENKPELIALIEAVTCTKTTEAWILLLDKAGIPNAPIQTIDQVASHPQTEALGILRSDGDNPASYFGLPISFDGHRPARNEPPPELGAHNEAFEAGE